MVGYRGEVLSPLLHVVLDPAHDGVINLLLRADIELLAADDVHQLIDRQQHKLFAFHHLKWREREREKPKVHLQYLLHCHSYSR